MRRAPLIALAMATALGGACGAGSPTVKADEMSAAQHREEASRQERASREHAANYDPAASRARPLPPPGGAPGVDYAFGMSVYNPTESHLQKADAHWAHAKQHEKAARTLEGFEEAHMRCHYAYARARAFEERVSCPLYMLGVEVKRARDPMAVEITTADPGRVEELRGRSREEAVYARGSGK